MIAWIAMAMAAPGDLSVGAFVGTHLSGAEHELYAAPDAVHGPLGPSFPLGIRAGIGIAGPLDLEGEAFVGPALGVGAGLMYGWRGQLTGRIPVPDAPVAPLITAGFGNLGLSSEDLGDDLDLAGHIGPGVEYATGNLVLRGDLRWMVSGRQGAKSLPGSHGELLIGVAFRKTRTIDTDGDGVPDPSDGCPGDAELPNGWQDEDGCPDTLATLELKLKNAEGGLVRLTQVKDGEQVIGTTSRDGALTIEGLMPGRVLALSADTPELEPASTEVTLAEGTNPVELVLGWAPGTLVVTAKSLGGTPIDAKVWAIGPSQERWQLGPTGESTRVLQPGSWNLMFAEDAYDAMMRSVELPATPGPRTVVDVVLRPQRVRIDSAMLVTLDPVEFELNADVLTPSSTELLEAVAAALVNNPDVTRVEIASWAPGSATTEALGLALAKKRGEAVQAALIALGVDASRLTVGVRPADPPLTAPGRPPRPAPGRIGFLIRETTGGPR